MIYCKKCGTKLPDDAVYCIKCGTKVDHPIDEHHDNLEKTQELPDLSAEADKVSLNNENIESTPDSPNLNSQHDAEKANKHGKRFWGLVLAVMLILVAIAAISSPDDNKPSSGAKIVESSNAEDQAAAKKAEEEKEAAIKKAHEEAIKPPVTLNQVTIKPNSIGEPQINLSMTNHSGKTIDAFKILVYAYDNYGTKLKAFGFGDDAFHGISQDPIGDGETTSPSRYWTLNGFDNGRKFVVRLMSLHFSDGSQWDTEDGQEVTVEGKFNP